MSMTWTTASPSTVTASLPLDGEFVAFDLETTGLSAQHDEITEIGAVILRDGQVVDTFQAFVNPGRSIAQKIVDLTGITDAMVADAPPISQVLPEFLAFCGGRVLCAHNADFDVGFLTAAAERLGLPFDPTYLDTLIFAQNLMPQLTNHKLDTVANALSLPDFNHHRASDDALTCGYLYLRFCQNAAGARPARHSGYQCGHALPACRKPHHEPPRPPHPAVCQESDGPA